jgi:aldose 1-epimerase
MGSETTISIAAGDLRLELSPSIGGAISAFEWTGAGRSWRILRKCNNPLENVLDAACFPLVPYVNRIRGGRFSFRGRDVTLAPNMPGDPSPLHGQGWLSPWRVDETSATSAHLSFHHDAGEWPWSYHAEQQFTLDEQGLSATLVCHNTDSEPMPCGLGFHPYFECGPETRIATAVESAWTTDADVLPVDQVPAAGRYDLRDRKICSQDLDNGFGGWGGSAVMRDPDWPFELRMSSPNASFFQLYSPLAGGIFVAEPVTHANAALNAPETQWPALGMRVLEPGEEMRLDMRIAVVPVQVEA